MIVGEKWPSYARLGVSNHGLDSHLWQEVATCSTLAIKIPECVLNVSSFFIFFSQPVLIELLSNTRTVKSFAWYPASSGHPCTTMTADFSASLRFNVEATTIRLPQPKYSAETCQVAPAIKAEWLQILIADGWSRQSGLG